MAKKAAPPTPEMEALWHTEVTDWNGKVIYDGPNPVPGELVTITEEMAQNGQQYTYRVRSVLDAEMEKVEAAS